MIPTIGRNLITTGTMIGSNETYIELASGNFARKLGPLTWNSMRIGMRWRFFHHPSITGITGVSDLPFYIGFCSGTGSVAGDASPQHFWGSKLYPATNQMTLQTGYWYYGYGFTYCKITNGIETNGSSFNPSTMFYYTSSVNAIMFDITKNGTSLVNTNTYFNVNNTTPEYYATSNWLVDLQTASPSHTGYYSSITNNIAYDEVTYGPLDSICVSWGRDWPRLQIIDIYVVRFG